LKLAFGTVAFSAVIFAQGFPPLVCTPGSFTGTYSLGPGNDGNQATGAGPFHLTATNSTFSYVQLITDGSFTFAQLQSLAANFQSNSGGSGGGAPRLTVKLFDGTTTRSLLIYLGNSPAFTDSDAVLNTWSGVNLIGNNDPGRYDTSNFPGGSPSSTYAAALALVGGQQVKGFSYVLDTFGAFPSRDETLTSITGSATGNASCVPDYIYYIWFYSFNHDPALKSDSFVAAE